MGILTNQVQITNYYLNISGNFRRKFSVKTRKVAFTFLMAFFFFFNGESLLGQDPDWMSQYTIIEDSVFTEYQRWENLSYVYVRNCTWENWIDKSASAVYMTDCDHIIFDNCTFKNIRGTGGGDVHAMNIVIRCDSIVVKNSYFENISADGMQIGLSHDTTQADAIMRDIIIENNTFIVKDDLSAENAIDVKGCDNLIFRNNNLSGFKGCNNIGCSGDIGNGIVIHRWSSKNVLIENNRIFDCNVGISASSGAPPRSGAPENIIIRNNFIYDNNTHITLFTNTNNAQLYHNTFGHYNRSVGTFNKTYGDTLFANNIFGYTDSYDPVNDMTIDAYDHMEGWNNKWVDLASGYFVDALNSNAALKDFRLTENATAVRNVGVDISSYYSDDLLDFDGTVRPGTVGHDVGAHQYVEGGCAGFNVTGVVTDADEGQSNGAINISASGGTSPYTYSWNDGATSEDRNSLNPGNYSVTVTDDSACTTSRSFQVDELVPDCNNLAISSASVTHENEGQMDGAIEITVTGGTFPYTFLWNDGSTDEDRTNIAGGNYSVTVTDNIGCTISGSLTVDVIAIDCKNLSISSSTVTNENEGQGNGAIDLTVTGGTTPYTYAWNDGETTQDRGGLSAGTYSIVVTDDLGCIVNDSYEISEIEPGCSNMSLSATVSNENEGESNGSILITVAGGAEPYSYSWNDGITSEDRIDIVAGNYSLVVTDDIGCQISGSYTIVSIPSSGGGTENQKPVVSIDYENDVYSGSLKTISAEDSFDPEGTPLSYRWIIPDDISIDRSDMSSINFLVPEVESVNTKTFILEVSDGSNTEYKSIDINFRPYKPEMQEIKVLSIQASTFSEDNYPENVLDNNDETRWSAQGVGEWISLELEKPVNISHFKVAFYNRTDRKAAFDLFASKNGEDWEPVLDGLESCGFSDDIHLYGLPETKAGSEYRYVRLVGKGNSENEWNSISELRIFGMLGSTSTTDGLNIEDILEVFPNPATHLITLNLEEDSKVKIFSISGKIYHSSFMTKGLNTLNIDYPSGTYFVQVQLENNKTFTQQIIVQ